MAAKSAAVSLAAVVGGGSVSVAIPSSSPAHPPRQQRLASISTPQQQLPRRYRRLNNAPCAAKSSSSAPPKGFGSSTKKKTSSSTGSTPTPPWLADTSACPCCSGRTFDTCCAPFLSGAALPQTAEQLMRSRFAAYVKKDAKYIIATTHPENRTAAGSERPDGTTAASTLAQDVAATIKRVSWQRLRVEGAEGGGRDDDEGFVTFTAWFKVTGQVGSRQDGGDAVGTMSERSRFVRVNEDGDNNEIGGGGGGEEGKPKRGRWSYREGMPVINGVPRVLS